MYQRVFIFELSGPTLDFLRERLDALPNFRRFFEHGAWGTLHSPLQPVAPQSFATLLTGRNPGATGLFDFFRFAAATNGSPSAPSCCASPRSTSFSRTRAGVWA
jgi:predicted AlkP superfamily phosphohydrolase/phosphomutase